MRRRGHSAGSVAVAVGIVLVSATPTSAAELPAADLLYSLTNTRLFTTTSTGAMTPITGLEGSGVGKYGADFDSTTGLVYYFAGGGTTACTVYSLDPITDLSTIVGEVGTTGIDECDALNVDRDGVMRVADQDGVMVTVNKTTGATVSSVTIQGDPAGDVSFIGQSSTGQFYAATYSGGLYTLDVTTGATMFVGSPTDFIETASFDSADTLWISGNGNSCPGLSSVSLSDLAGSFTVQGDFLDADSTCQYVSGMAFVTVRTTAPPPPAEEDQPELAPTGTTPTAAAALLAMLALIVGAAAVASVRRTSLRAL